MLNANITCWESFDVALLTKLERIGKGFANRMLEHTIRVCFGDSQAPSGKTFTRSRANRLTIKHLLPGRSWNKSILFCALTGTRKRSFSSGFILRNYESARVHSGVCKVAEDI